MLGLACLTLALSALGVDGFARHLYTQKTYDKRSVYPAPVKGYKTITSPLGVKVHYKEPGKAGVCETTYGVNSYSGYVEVSPNMHAFFWFFESRNKPATDPVTLWLNGGPGSDSQIGLFNELGPCMIDEHLRSYVNKYSWSNVSNFMFLSQPYGVGFSYETEEPGSFNPITGVLQNTSVAPATGRWPDADVEEIDTTHLAAVAAWHTMQAFYNVLPQLDPTVQSIEFNLWTESYGGHYGPSFFDYFQDRNAAIAAGAISGKLLNFNSLGIGNGIIDELIQAPYYPEFARYNTYGIKAYNKTVYDYAKFAYYMGYGCHDQIIYCNLADRSTPAGQAVCTEAENMCRDNVEGPYYVYGGRGVYDIRHPYDDPNPPNYFIEYLNLPAVQQAIGVNLNYTEANDGVYYAFQQTGDFVYPDFLTDLGRILDSGVRVSLYYGDADYICNWFGGEAVSLQVPYAHSKAFAAAGYAPFMVNGVEYGVVRQHGNFSFTRIYEAGHLVPYYQPLAALELFNRSIHLVDIATGTKLLNAGYDSHGPASATHTEPFVPLPTTSTLTSASPTVTGPNSVTPSAAAASGLPGAVWRALQGKMAIDWKA